LATNDESNSIHSSALGVAELDTASLISAGAELDRFTIFTETTEKVAAGTVYAVVADVDVMLAVPNLPVAILKSPFNYLKSNSKLLGNLLLRLGS
jgi:hypothetical protein